MAGKNSVTRKLLTTEGKFEVLECIATSQCHALTPTFATGTVNALLAAMRILLILTALATIACSKGAAATPDRSPSKTSTVNQPAPSPRSGPQPVEVEMRNVDLRVTENVTMRVHHLRGRFVPSGRAEAPYLDDKHSYSVAIDSGEILLDTGSLNALMNRTMELGDANVEKIRISTEEGNRLRQKGLLDKGIKLPFDVKGGVEATPDGRIRLRAASVRSLGISLRPLMKIFSIEMDDMVKVKPGHGVTVEGNDLILDPQELIPAPAIRGRVTSVRVVEGGIVQTFGTGERRRLSPQAISQNYIYWRGGELQFGKLTMVETDLELIDDDPTDPFVFSVDHWNDQLVAGYSKNTTSGGLKTHMPDHNDLKRQPASKQ